MCDGFLANGLERVKENGATETLQNIGLSPTI
jgi:hypothetical protein